MLKVSFWSGAWLSVDTLSVQYLFFSGFFGCFFSTDGLGMGDCLEMVPRDYPNLSKSILLFKLIGLGFCQVKNIVEPPEFLYIFDHVCVLSTPLDWRKSKINSFLKTILFFSFWSHWRWCTIIPPWQITTTFKPMRSVCNLLIFFFRPFGVSELATSTFGNVPVFWFGKS